MSEKRWTVWRTYFDGSVLPGKRTLVWEPDIRRGSMWGPQGICGSYHNVKDVREEGEFVVFEWGPNPNGTPHIEKFALKRHPKCKSQAT